ncbi:MAG TPA: phosphoribosyltransferase family protein [Rubricoccaceae bacterium]
MPERHNPTPPPPADPRGATGRAYRGARRAVRDAASAVAGLVYPDLCLGCDRRVPGRADEDPLAGLPLCPTCLAALPPAPPAGTGPALAGATASGTVAAAVALWAYDAGGTVRRVQHALKYGGHERIGRPLGHLVGAACARAGFGPVDLVVPVPLASVRLLERGYNQSAALAAGVAGKLGAEWRTDRLVRTRSTRSQTALTAAERQANVDGAFAVPAPWTVDGRHVLLVDDVLTTGATLVAAARPLGEAGARVSVATLAVAGA